MTVEEVRGSLDLTDNGAIKNSIRNCLTVFQNDPVLQGAVRYNILTERIDIVKPLWWSKQTATLTDTDLNYLMLYLEDKYSLTSEKKIQKALSIIADSNKYHPIRDYLNGLEWDGTERIRYALPRFLGAEEGEYTYQALRLFMLGAISRVFKPGCKFEVMLCLVGGQGAGKSTFFRLLAVKDEWFSDDLKKIDDDNVYRKMQGHWIIEMSEMIATANAKSIEDIKSFISRAKETYKVPYETHPADRLRQCVFGGSSNTMDFLPLDRSGNRRFLPIMVHPENAEMHNLKQMSATLMLYQQYGFSSPDELDAAISAANTATQESLAGLKGLEAAIREKKELQRNLLGYIGTKPARDGLKAQKSEKARRAYREQHESDFIIADTAARYFREHGITKLPASKALQREIEQLTVQKNAGYNDYREKRQRAQELQTVRRNIDQILRGAPSQQKKREQER